MLNDTALNSKLPTLLKPLIALLVLAIFPALVALIGPFCALMSLTCDKIKPDTYHKYDRRVERKPNCIQRHLFCHNYKNSYLYAKISGFLFIALPFWSLLTSIYIALSVITFTIIVIPTYIFAIFVFLRMVCWWSKNKRLDSSKLSED